jgi:hypothetical protein
MKKVLGFLGGAMAVPALAFAVDPFTVTLPTFDWSNIGTIGTTMLAVVAAIVVYRKVKGIISRG